MFPLIKIRLTYLKRNRCMLVFSYLLIPLILIVSIIIYAATTKISKKVEFNPKRTFDFDYDKTLFDDAYNYQEILPHLRNTSLVCKNGKKGEDFKQFIKNKFNIELEIFPDEKSLDKYWRNIIIMNYDEKKKAYEFSYKQNKGSAFSEDLSEFKFPFNLISSEAATDIFNYSYFFDDEKDENENPSSTLKLVKRKNLKIKLIYIYYINL